MNAEGNDTTTHAEMASTLGQMVATTLIQGAGAMGMLAKAKEALDAGDVERAHRAIHNGAAMLPSPYLWVLFCECLPRSGEPSSGMG